MASLRTIASRLSPRLSSLSPKHLTRSSLSLSQLSSSGRVPRSISRLPAELTGAMSLMPLHNATASLLMRSSLAVEYWSWGLVPQGLSMPL